MASLVYNCSHCDIKFDSANSLRVHLQFNHGGNIFFASTSSSSTTTTTTPSWDSKGGRDRVPAISISPSHSRESLGGLFDDRGCDLLSLESGSPPPDSLLFGGLQHPFSNNSSYVPTLASSPPTSTLSVSLYADIDRLKSNLSPTGGFRAQNLPSCSSVSSTPTPGSSGSTGDLAISPSQPANMISYVEQSSPSAILGTASHLHMQQQQQQSQHLSLVQHQQQQHHLYHHQPPQHHISDMVSGKISDNLLCGADPASDYLSGINNELENESSAEEIWDLDSHTVKRYNNAPMEQAGELDGLGPLPPFSMTSSSLPSNHMLGDPYSSVSSWSNGGHHGYPRQPLHVVGRGPQHHMSGYPPAGPGSSDDSWMMGGSGVGSPTMGNNGSKRSDDLKKLKTYQCEACDKWFTSSGHLKRHYNTTLHKNATRQKTSPTSTHSEGSPLSGSSSSRPHSGLMPYADDSLSYKGNQPCSPTPLENSGRGGSQPIHPHSISSLNSSTSLSNSSAPSLMNNNNNHPNLSQNNTSNAATPPMTTSIPPANNNNINNIMTNRVNAQSPFYQQIHGSNSPSSAMRSASSPGMSGKMTPSSPMHHQLSSPMRQQQLPMPQLMALGGSPHNNRQGMSPPSPQPLGGHLSNTPIHENSSSNLSGEDSNQSGGKVQSVTDCLLFGRPQESPSSPLMRGGSYHQLQPVNGPNSPANMYSPDSASIVTGRSIIYSSSGADLGMAHQGGGLYALPMAQQHRGMSPMDHYGQQSQQFSYHGNYGCDYPSPHHPNGGLPSFQSSLYAPSPARYPPYGQHLSMALIDTDMDPKKDMDMLSNSDHLSVTAGDGLDGIPTCSTPSDCGTSTPGLSVSGNQSLVGSNGGGGGGSGGSGDFRCSECNKGFNRICYLKQHNKSFHNGEKPYKCGQCGKRFPGEVLCQVSRTTAAYCQSTYFFLRFDRIPKGRTCLNM